MVELFREELPELKLEEHFVVYVDFLGTRAAIGRNKNALDLLGLFYSLAEYRSDFSATSEDMGGGLIKSTTKPAFSSFSDSIVISSSLDQLKPLRQSEHHLLSSELERMRWFLSRIARMALGLGFLIRGGATIGPLYHSDGVVFGEALVEAYEIESKASMYPRVVLSSKIGIKERLERGRFPLGWSNDGLAHIDYYSGIIFGSAQQESPNYAKEIGNNFLHFMGIISEKLAEFNNDKMIREYAKWGWFADNIRVSLQKESQALLEEWGISLDKIPKAKF